MARVGIRWRLAAPVIYAFDASNFSWPMLEQDTYMKAVKPELAWIDLLF